MRISAFNYDGFEERRRVLQRKEANDAYKKNAIYTQAKKNPMLKILEDLLSGKTEKELFEKNQTENDNLNPLAPEIYDNMSLIESPQEEIASELKQSAVEAASDEEEVNRIPTEQFDFLIPELLAPAIGRSAVNDPIKTIVFDKKYMQAVSSYTYQMQMAQNGFKIEQPKLSYIA